MNKRASVPVYDHSGEIAWEHKHSSSGYKFEHLLQGSSSGGTETFDTTGESPVTQGETVSEKELDTGDLYSNPEAIRPELNNAIRLLNEGVDQIQEAIDLIRNDDLLGSDDAVNRLMGLLPELFCCGQISEGLAGLVNAVFYGISNHQGTSLNESQLVQIKEIFKLLLEEPFLPFERALDEMEALETLGFSIDAKNLSLIDELGNG